MKAIIWRESVYKNNFRCSHCGAQLYDIFKDEPTEYLGHPPGDEETLYCLKCKTAVAFFKDYDGPIHGKLGGRFRGDLK